MYIEDEAVVKENVGKREDEASVDPPKRVVLRETTFPLPDSPHPNRPTKPPTMQPTQGDYKQLNGRQRQPTQEGCGKLNGKLAGRAMEDWEIFAMFVKTT